MKKRTKKDQISSGDSYVKARQNLVKVTLMTKVKHLLISQYLNQKSKQLSTKYLLRDAESRRIQLITLPMKMWTVIVK